MYIFITPIIGTDKIIPGIPKNPPPTVTASIVKNGLRPNWPPTILGSITATSLCWTNNKYISDNKTKLMLRTQF